MEFQVLNLCHLTNLKAAKVKLIHFLLMVDFNL